MPYITFYSPEHKVLLPEIERNWVYIKRILNRNKFEEVAEGRYMNIKGVTCEVTMEPQYPDIVRTQGRAGTR